MASNQAMSGFKLLPIELQSIVLSYFREGEEPNPGAVDNKRGLESVFKLVEAHPSVSWQEHFRTLPIKTGNDSKVFLDKLPTEDNKHFSLTKIINLYGSSFTYVGGDAQWQGLWSWQHRGPLLPRLSTIRIYGDAPYEDYCVLASALHLAAECTTPNGSLETMVDFQHQRSNGCSPTKVTLAWPDKPFTFFTGWDYTSSVDHRPFRYCLARFTTAFEHPKVLLTRVVEESYELSDRQNRPVYDASFSTSEGCVSLTIFTYGNSDVDEDAVAQWLQTVWSQLQ